MNQNRAHARPIMINLLICRPICMTWLRVIYYMAFSCLLGQQNGVSSSDLTRDLPATHWGYTLGTWRIRWLKAATYVNELRAHDWDGRRGKNQGGCRVDYRARQPTAQIYGSEKAPQRVLPRVKALAGRCGIDQAQFRYHPFVRFEEGKLHIETMRAKVGELCGWKHLKNRESPFCLTTKGPLERWPFLCATRVG